MKRAQLKVPWRDGLHLRPATRLVRLAQKFHSTISLQANGRIADARSILNVLLLCAALGTVIDVEASGIDEEQALQAVESAFHHSESSPDLDLDAGTDSDADEHRR